MPFDTDDMKPKLHPDVIRLSIEDQRQIAQALLNPPEPKPALKRAFKRRRQLLEKRLARHPSVG